MMQTNQTNQMSSPPASYPQQWPPQQQQPMAYPDNKPAQMPGQFYYPQQQPPMPPSKPFSATTTASSYNSNPSSNELTPVANSDLNNQMSNLSLDGDESQNGKPPPPASYQQNIPNNYQQTAYTGMPNQNYQSNANPVPPTTPQPPPVQSQQYNYNGNYNYNQQQQPPPPQQQQPSSTNSWNPNAYPPPPMKPNQQPPLPPQQPSFQPNYNSFDQQQNGRIQNFPPQPQQQQSPGAYGSYQPQPQQYPPQPMAQGFNSGGGGGQMSPTRFPYQGSGQFAPTNQQNKLDPDAMPSVIQVILEDKVKYETNNNVIFTTTIPGTVPPLVTTIMENENQVVEDGGSARPIFMRPTIYQVPITEDNLKTSDIPFGIVMKPFDDLEVEGKIYVPVSNSEIVRCNRCKGYMNPYNRFIDGGRRFQCCLCHHVTEITSTYFANLDHTGQRLDKFQRPELYLGSYEFRATEEYCRNNVMNNRRPHIIFACELTETSKPILNYLSIHLAEIIRNFPKDPLSVNTQPPLVGFVTYNSKIQIYDIINNGHAHIICDLSTPFPPLNTFLVDPLVHMDKIESFLKSLPQLFVNEELEMQTVLGPVIEAALLTTQSDVNNWINQGQPNKVVNDGQQNPTYETIPVGKAYIFHCTLPSYGSDADTPGRIKQRWTTSIDEIRKLLGTDKEKTVLAPETNKYYVGLGQKCVTDFASGIELFLFPPANSSFLDVATLGELTRLTGTGGVFKYFNDFSDSFLVDLKYSLYSSFAFDCVLKVRTSTGIRAHEYFGNFYSRSPNDIECAAINTNSNIAVEFKYDDKLAEDEHVVIQVAILYTSLSGERRIRLHNMALSTCQQIGDIYRNACCDTIVNLLARNAVHYLRRGDKTIQQTKESVITRVINILTSYRKHCAQPGTSLGQLILPEALKLLPMYLCGMLKCDAIDGGPEMNPDDKAYAQLKLLGSFPSLSQVFLYPRLYKIEYENESEDSLKYSLVRCSSHKLSSTASAYIMENGFFIFVLITTAGCANVKFLNAIFGPNVDSALKIPMEMGLPSLLTNESQFINSLIKKIESERKRSYKVFLVRQGIDKIESVFKSFLYEDQKIVTRNAGDSKLEGLSYVDLLCHLHKEIRAQLN